MFDTTTLEKVSSLALFASAPLFGVVCAGTPSAVAMLAVY
jgi:hypothetical protein